MKNLLTEEECIVFEEMRIMSFEKEAFLEYLLRFNIFYEKSYESYYRLTEIERIKKEKEELDKAREKYLAKKAKKQLKRSLRGINE